MLSPHSQAHPSQKTPARLMPDKPSDVTPSLMFLGFGGVFLDRSAHSHLCAAALMMTIALTAVSERNDII